HDPGVVVAQERLEELTTAVAHPDEPEADLLVGPHDRSRAQRGPRGGRQGGLGERPAAHVVGHRSGLPRGAGTPGPSVRVGAWALRPGWEGTSPRVWNRDRAAPSGV